MKTLAGKAPPCYPLPRKLTLEGKTPFLGQGTAFRAIEKLTLARELFAFLGFRDHGQLFINQGDGRKPGAFPNVAIESW